MKIDTIRINGIRNPVGFDMPRVTVSWKVRETASAEPLRQQRRPVRISTAAVATEALPL